MTRHSRNFKHKLTCSSCRKGISNQRSLTCDRSRSFCQKCGKKHLGDVAVRLQGAKISATGNIPDPQSLADAKRTADGKAEFRLKVELEPGLSELGKVVNVLCVEGLRVFHVNQSCDSLIKDIFPKWQSLNDAVKATARIQAIVEKMVQREREIAKERREYQQKMLLVKTEILRRHSRIVDQANKYRDAAVAALESSSTVEELTLCQKLNEVRKNSESLRCLLVEIEKASGTGDEERTDSKAASKLSSRGETVIEKLMLDTLVKELRRPVHRSELPVDDAMFQTMKNFIGTGEIVTLQCPDVEEELAIRERFRCGEDDDVTVFCVKAKNNGSVNVSFDPTFQDQMPRPKVCGENGRKQLNLRGRESQTQFGRISFIERDGCLTFLKTHLFNSVFAKSVAAITSTWILNHGESGCFVVSDQLASVKPLETRQKELFSIKSKSCRAMDLDQTQQYFVVVEEGVNPATQRKVLLYRRPDTDSSVTAVHTYTSPITPFQPADVCFYTLLGQQVLMIADETNDALHVAEVKDDRVTFTRFLCPGCPLLLQPTALNTDLEGRLWVGCRGGRLVTVHSLSAHVTAALAAGAYDRVCDDDNALFYDDAYYDVIEANVFSARGDGLDTTLTS